MLKKMKEIVQCTALMWLLCGWGEASEKAVTIKLAVTDHPLVLVMLGDTMRQAYRKLGYAISFEVMPPGRGLIESSSGKVDGEIVRLDIIESRLNSLLRVPVPIAKVSVHLFCIADVTCDESVLDSADNFVGVIAGDSLSPILLENKKVSTIPIKNAVSLEKMLRGGRLTYILSLMVEGEQFLMLPDEFGVSERPLASFTAYHYLHRKHVDLIPDVAESLKMALKSHPMKSIADARKALGSAPKQ